MNLNFYEYGSFGEPLRVWKLGGFNPFQFSTKYTYSKMELSYYNFFNNPSTGRWISRDPIGELGGVNLYCFVLNRPIDLTDATGLTCKELPEWRSQSGSWAIKSISWNSPPGTVQETVIDSLNVVYKASVKTHCDCCDGQKAAFGTMTLKRNNLSAGGMMGVTIGSMPATCGLTPEVGHNQTVVSSLDC